MSFRWVGRILDFLRINQGTTTVEYAVMLAIIIVGAIAAVLTCGDSLRESWQAIDFESQKALK